ncbi:TPA: hypothetical protein NIV08_003278, partial [Klebsiella pneumoniae]|nr:hypothetical protein [Klebsiella pneumoniae]
MATTDTQQTAQFAAEAAVSAAEAKQYLIETQQGYQDISATTQEAINAATAAEAAKVAAETAEQDAQNAASSSTESATAAAESASQAAQSAAAATEFADNKFTFPTTADGLAATTNGQYFRVPQGVDNDTSFIYYQNNSGVAVESAALPGAESIAELNRKITYDDLQLIGALGGDDSNACILVDQYGEVFLVGIGGQSLQYKLKL